MDRFGRYLKEENVQLIIQSEKGIWLPICVLVGYGAIMLGNVYFQDIMYFLGKAYKVEVDRLAVMIIATIIGTYIVVKEMFSYGCAFGRKLLMDKEGCVVSFLIFHRVYKWDELAIKRLEDYSYMKYDGVRWNHTNPFKEGIFFSYKKVRKKANMLPRDYCRKKRPWSTFFVNFYPYGLQENWQEKMKDKNKIDFLDILEFKIECPKRPWELYPVDKELFFHYMDLWGVEIEGHQKEEG